MRAALRSCALLLAFGVVAACERAEPDREAAPEVDTTAVVEAPAPETTTVDSLRVAIDRLVRGEGGSESSWFSAQTAGVVREIGFDTVSRGATVDFNDLRQVIPNASSSAGSQMLLNELNAAVFSVGGVEWVQYGMEGDCELFGEWLQYGECLSFTRQAAGL